MKFTLKQSVAVASLLVASLLPVQAEITLKVGDPAPKLQVGKWIQGDPVETLETGTAYIVEFWATWCGPCRATIPHLNEVHKKFQDKGLVVIGQDVFERTESAVPRFVKEMGDKMTYRVALDDKEGNARGKMAETWMEAAGQKGIPAAFFVNKQKRIAWIGHPSELNDSLVERVLDGSYDIDKAAAAYATRMQNEGALEEIQSKLNAAAREGDWDAAEAALDQMEKLLPEEDRLGMSMLRFRILMSKGDYEAGHNFAREVSDANQDNAKLQNELSWSIATMDGIKERDLGLALTIAKRASAAADNKNPDILDTLARIYFMKGDKDRAVDLQTQAIDLAERGMKDQFRKTLDSYRKGVLPES